MNLEVIKAAITSKTARQVLLTKKHSPKILFVAGTVGVIGTVVLACRATLKVDSTLDAHNVEAEGINELRLGVAGKSDDEIQRRQTKLKVKTAIEIVKPYLPAIGLGALSIGALTGSHVILTRRNGALMATYAGLDRAYKEYRQRVSDEYGKDVDRKFALGGEDVLVEEKTAEGGIKTTVVKKDGKTGGGSPYARLFGAHCPKFSKEPGRNAEIVMFNQNWATDKLRTNGHLFLNEVYDMLGLSRTPAGAVVGWIYRHDNEEKNGDNYVSFGVFDGDHEAADDFINGHENEVWLDFNVDGVIYDKI